MPSTCAAHRESTKHHATFIDPVPLPNRLNHFKHVGFTGPTVSVIGATKNIELDEIKICRDRLRRIVGLNETHFVQRSAATMKLDVETPLPVRIFAIFRRDQQTIRLNRMIDS